MESQWTLRLSGTRAGNSTVHFPPLSFLVPTRQIESAAKQVAALIYGPALFSDANPLTLGLLLWWMGSKQPRLLWGHKYYFIGIIERDPGPLWFSADLVTSESDASNSEVCGGRSVHSNSAQRKEEVGLFAVHGDQIVYASSKEKCIITFNDTVQSYLRSSPNEDRIKRKGKKRKTVKWL